MKHEQCKQCKHCAWVATINEKWICECMRPKFWGRIDEDNKDCDYYQYFCWKEDWSKDELKEMEMNDTNLHVNDAARQDPKTRD